MRKARVTEGPSSVVRISERWLLGNLLASLDLGAGAVPRQKRSESPGVALGEEAHGLHELLLPTLGRSKWHPAEDGAKCASWAGKLGKPQDTLCKSTTHLVSACSLRPLTQRPFLSRRPGSSFVFRLLLSQNKILSTSSCQCLRLTEHSSLSEPHTHVPERVSDRASREGLGDGTHTADQQGVLRLGNC